MAERIGRRRRAGRARARWATLTMLPAVLLILSSVPAAPQSTASISGQVVSAADEEPLPHAQVRLTDQNRTAITDRDGRFLFSELEPGSLILVVTFLGTTSEPMEVRLTDGELERVLISMDVALEPITAAIARSQRPGKLRGFYRRMDSEQGYFITRADIQDRRPRRMTDMLRRVPGVEVGRADLGPVGVRMGRGRPCPIQYFVDGVRAPFFDIDNVLPDDVAGVEIYPGVARVPIQFRYQATCGAIVIWTRDPAEP